MRPRLNIRHSGRGGPIYQSLDQTPQLNGCGVPGDNLVIADPRSP